MLTIGVDPDLHALAIAAWKDGAPLSAGVLLSPMQKGRSQQASVILMSQQIKNGIPRFVAEVSSSGYVDRVAVEAQTLQRTGLRQHKRPQDIVALGNVAGAALMAADAHSLFQTHFPTPETWKGQIPKHVMQARLYDDLGWGYEMCASNSYAIPLRPTQSFAHITRGQWKHVGDALLLAKWVAEQPS